MTRINDGANGKERLLSLAADSSLLVADHSGGPWNPGSDDPVDVKTAARFLGVSASLVYAYVERKQIPHFRMMGRTIRFSLAELERWRQQFREFRLLSGCKDLRWVDVGRDSGVSRGGN